MNPNYTVDTDDLGDFVMATYICEVCEREWYDDADTPNPIGCPYCGTRDHTTDTADAAGEQIPALGDVFESELPAERARRWVVLFPDDYETFARDPEGNVALKVDIEQAGEMLALAAESVAGLSDETADGEAVLRDLIERLEAEVSDDE